MNIDLTKLITNALEEIEIEQDVVIPRQFIQDTSIRELKNVRFCGGVTKLCDGDYQVAGLLSGIMILPDDVTLEVF